MVSKLSINIKVAFLQESIPVVEKFLVLYLKTWNGKDYFLEILRLMNFIRITDFEGNYPTVIFNVKTF